MGLFYNWYHPQMIPNILESVQLYFGSFEFNASFYRLLLFFNVAPDWIRVILKSFSIIGFVTIWLITWKQNLSIKTGLFWTYTIYLLFSQSIHPWYIVPLLPFAIFSQYAFPFIWSFLIFFTYYTYRDPQHYEQSSLIIIIEYVIVFASIAMDLWKPRYIINKLGIFNTVSKRVSTSEKKKVLSISTKDL